MIMLRYGSNTSKLRSSLICLNIEFVISNHCLSETACWLGFIGYFLKLQANFFTWNAEGEEEVNEEGALCEGKQALAVDGA